MSEYLEVFIRYKDGGRDWVSPIEDAEEDIVFTDKTVKIDNGIYEYIYALRGLEKVLLIKVTEDEEKLLEVLYKGDRNERF